jgi:hypothetical protein
MSETPDERKGIVKDAMAQFMKEHPDWAAKPKDDLTVLFESFEAKCRETAKLLEPILENEITNSTIHNPMGRRNFLLQSHKAFIESFHTFNKEELKEMVQSD